MHTNRGLAATSGTGGGRAHAPAMVFVVDDDPVLRLLVSSVLKKAGYRVAHAADGADALRRIAGGEGCELLITDMQMPNLDGIELIQRLRANPSTATLPILILTGDESSDTARRGGEMLIDGFIVKPVDPSRLLDRVRGALRRDH